MDKGRSVLGRFVKPPQFCIEPFFDSLYSLLVGVPQESSSEVASALCRMRSGIRNFPKVSSKSRRSLGGAQMLNSCVFRMHILGKPIKNIHAGRHLHSGSKQSSRRRIAFLYGSQTICGSGVLASSSM